MAHGKKRNHSGPAMESDLSLEFLRVVEQAAIACAHTMGQGDRHGSDQAAVEAMRRELDTVPIDGTIVIGEGERDEAPMLFIGEKVGMAGKPTAIAAPTTRSTSPSIRSRAPTCARRARPTRSRCWPPRTRAGCCTRPTSTWRSWSSGPAPSTSSISTRRCARTCGRSPGALGRQVDELTRRGARSPAPREADRRHPRHRRAHPPDRRRRPVGRHRRGGVGQRRPRGDGHRRRARRRADRGGDALPERRDLRPAGHRQARRRGALPRHGHHRHQAGLHVGRPGLRQEHHLRRHRRHRRHAC